MPVVISNGLPRGDNLGMFTSHWPTERIACIVIYSTKWSYFKNYECQKYERKKSAIHDNSDANITYDFGDGDISRYRSRFPHTCSLPRL